MCTRDLSWALAPVRPTSFDGARPGAASPVGARLMHVKYVASSAILPNDPTDCPRRPTWFAPDRTADSIHINISYGERQLFVKMIITTSAQLNIITRGGGVKSIATVRPPTKPGCSVHEWSSRTYFALDFLRQNLPVTLATEAESNE